MTLLEGRSSRSIPLKLIWKSCVPPKVCFFVWETWWGRILTMEPLKKWGFLLASRFPLCGNAEEGINHLLVHCPSVWKAVAGPHFNPKIPWCAPF